MLKHYIEGNNYKIVNELNNIVLSIELIQDLPGDQIILKTDKEVYAGPIELFYNIDENLKK